MFVGNTKDTITCVLVDYCITLVLRLASRDCACSRLLIEVTDAPPWACLSNLEKSGSSRLAASSSSQMVTAVVQLELDANLRLTEPDFLVCSSRRSRIFLRQEAKEPQALVVIGEGFLSRFGA